MKQMSDYFVELGRKQATLFSENHIPYIECVVTCKGIRNIMLTVYNSCVFKKKIIPLEAMEHSDKLTVWETAKEMAKGRLDSAGCTELSKVLYTIEYYLTHP